MQIAAGAQRRAAEKDSSRRMADSVALLLAKGGTGGIILAHGRLWAAKMKEQKRAGYQGTRRANRNTARRPHGAKKWKWKRDREKRRTRIRSRTNARTHTRKNVAVVYRSISIRGKVEENEKLRSFQSGSSRLLRWNLDRANVTPRFRLFFTLIA